MTEPKKYRKRPVEIEAMQWDGTASGATPIINWILNGGGTASYWAPGEWDAEAPKAAYISTLEGSMLASPTDWIIRGVAGEFYPCRADIFTATYEAVES